MGSSLGFGEQAISDDVARVSVVPPVPTARPIIAAIVLAADIGFRRFAAAMPNFDALVRIDGTRSAIVR
jgi:hypothetical protein